MTPRKLMQLACGRRIDASGYTLDIPYYMVRKPLLLIERIAVGRQSSHKQSPHQSSEVHSCKRCTFDLIHNGIALPLVTLLEARLNDASSVVFLQHLRHLAGKEREHFVDQLPTLPMHWAHGDSLAEPCLAVSMTRPYE
jgi:hypothetical protein